MFGLNIINDKYNLLKADCWWNTVLYLENVFLNENYKLGSEINTTYTKNLSRFEQLVQFTNLDLKRS